MKNVLLLILFLKAINLYAQPASQNVHKYSKQDTSQGFSEAQLKGYASSVYARAYKALSFEEKMFAEKELKKLQQKDSTEEMAVQLSGTASLLMAQSKAPNLFLVLSSAAVQTAPQNALINNNFGAILHHQDSLKPALKVLLYAKSLSSISPLIYTNLGNVLFELYDDRNAEIFFKRALRLNGHFNQAREGLVLCYLKRKDIGKAYEELLKGVESVSYSPVAKKAFDVIQNSGEKDKRKTNPELPPSKPRTNTPGRDKVPVPVNMLELPDFPDWGDRETFIHAGNAMSQWNKDLNAQIKEVDDEISAISNRKIEKLKQIKNLPYDQQEIALKAVMNNYHMDRLEYSLGLLQLYYDDQLEKIWHNANEREKALTTKFTKGFEQWAAAYIIQEKELLTKQPVVDPKAFQTWAIGKCKEKQQMINDYYKDWRASAKDRHNKTTDLLHEYWIYVEPFLNQVYDMNMFNELDAKRRRYVYSKMAAFPTIYSLTSFAMNMAGLDLAGGLNGKCAQETPESKKESSSDLTTKVPKGKAPDCPVTSGTKVKFSFAGMINITGDCTSLEVEGWQTKEGGVIASIKRDFRDHETTIFVGAGLKGDVAGWGATVKGGGYVKFNDRGDISDVGITGKASTSISDGLRSFGSNAGFTVGAMTGINGKLGTEVAYKVY